MYYLINKKELNRLIGLENKLAQDKSHYNDFCILCTIIDNILQRDNALKKIDDKEVKK